MAKDPTPRADALQAMRESRYGHLQAKADGIAAWTNPKPPAEIVKEHIERDKAERLAELRKAAEAKLRPFAGKKSRGVAAKGSVPSPRKPRKPKGTKA